MSRTIHQKKCAGCGKLFETISKLRRYCTRNCNRAYTPTQKQYIKDNWGKQSPAEIAAHINITERSLLKYVSDCRVKKVEGMILPKLQGDVPIGTTRERNNGKRGKYLVIQTEDGWKYLRAIKDPNAVPQPRQPRKKKTKPKQDMASNRTAYKGNERYNRRKREEDKRLPTRVIDLTTKKRVYIPKLKMHVFVSIEVSDAEVIRKFSEQHEFEMGRMATGGFNS